MKDTQKLIRGPLEARMKECWPGRTQSLPATLPLDDCYKTPHQIPPPTLGWDTVLRGVWLLAPFTVTLFFPASHSAHLHKDCVSSVFSIQIRDRGLTKAWLLQCFLPASPGSLVHHWRMHHQPPALFLGGARFPCLSWAPRLISCCWKGLSVVCQLRREERERAGPLPLLC